MQQSPFQQSLYIKIEERVPGFYDLLAMNDEQLILPPETWISKLYFKHEPSFYGLHVATNERHITIAISELLDLLCTRYKNPFLTIQGANEASQELLTYLSLSAQTWERPDLWQLVTVNPEAEQVLQFDNSTIDSMQQNY